MKCVNHSRFSHIRTGLFVLAHAARVSGCANGILRAGWIMVVGPDIHPTSQMTEERKKE